MLDPRTVGLRGALNSLNRHRIHAGPETLADRVFAPSLLMDLVLILCGTAIVALSAQFVVPIWPVPSTGQIVGVLLVGFSLGALRGGLALVLYVLIGALGAPVFNQGGAGWAHIMGDTGGYLFGFVAAAILAGLCAARRWDRTFVTVFACSLAATFVVYVFGVAHLMAVRNYGFVTALEDGFLPLIASGVVKVLVIAIAIAYAWKHEATVAA